MITPAWCRVMAAYNTEMNLRLYAAAGRLTDSQRREDRGIFFGSIHATLAHLIWADRQWMSRFDNWQPPTPGIAANLAPDRAFSDLAAERVAIDARLEAWAAQLEAEALSGDLVWFSGAVGAELTRPRWVTVTHMFNHQTHHRGQVHAVLTGFGEKTGATDLPFVLEF